MEWTADCYGSYQRAAPDDAPRGNCKAGFVLRGASWYGTDVHSAIRFNDVPFNRNDLIGFRLAASVVDGEKIYKKICITCHDAGILGAPKLGDTEAWAPRIAQGMDSLYESTLNGKNAMPVRGGYSYVSDEEVKAVVDWMVQNSQPASSSKSGGERIYNAICFSCHDVGVAGSPKLGDAEEWNTRLKGGVKSLYQSALNGKGAMPAKGGNRDLSDDEIKSAVDWMIEKSVK